MENHSVELIPESFDRYKFYTIDRFLEIIASHLNYALTHSGEYSEQTQYVLMQWESRVLDLLDQDKENKDQYLIGFVTGMDKIIRLNIAIRPRQ